MMHLSFAARAAAAVIVVGVFVLNPAAAQLAGGTAPGTKVKHPYPPPTPRFAGGPGFGWGYPGLYGGPFIGWPYYSGAYGGFWTNGLSLYGPPIPTYGPQPGVFGNNDFNRTWQNYLQPGFGWFGVYAASPRPHPSTVNVWPTPPIMMESVPVLPSGVATPSPGGCLILSVRLPQPAAEVLVDGVPTAQTGTDRIFESPPLDGGRDYKYELTARWMEGGVMVESKRTASGKPGDVVRLDFTKPEELPVAVAK